jgi:hypothetical protein
MTLLRPAFTDVLISLTACLAASLIVGIEGLAVACFFAIEQLHRGIHWLFEPGVIWKERGNDKL